MATQTPLPFSKYLSCMIQKTKLDDIDVSERKQWFDIKNNVLSLGYSTFEEGTKKPKWWNQGEVPLAKSNPSEPSFFLPVRHIFTTKESQAISETIKYHPDKFFLNDEGNVMYLQDGKSVVMDPKLSTETFPNGLKGMIDTNTKNNYVWNNNNIISPNLLYILRRSSNDHVNYGKEADDASSLPACNDRMTKSIKPPNSFIMPAGSTCIICGNYIHTGDSAYSQSDVCDNMVFNEDNYPGYNNFMHAACFETWKGDRNFPVPCPYKKDNPLPGSIMNGGTMKPRLPQDFADCLSIGYDRNTDDRKIVHIDDDDESKVAEACNSSYTYSRGPSASEYVNCKFKGDNDNPTCESMQAPPHYVESGVCSGDTCRQNYDWFWSGIDNLIHTNCIMKNAPWPPDPNNKPISMIKSCQPADKGCSVMKCVRDAECDNRRWYLLYNVMHSQDFATYYKDVCDYAKHKSASTIVWASPISNNPPLNIFSIADIVKRYCDAMIINVDGKNRYIDPTCNMFKSMISCAENALANENLVNYTKDSFGGIDFLLETLETGTPTNCLCIGSIQRYITNNMMTSKSFVHHLVNKVEDCDPSISVAICKTEIKAGGDVYMKKVKLSEMCGLPPSLPSPPSPQKKFPIYLLVGGRIVLFCVISFLLIFIIRRLLQKNVIGLSGSSAMRNKAAAG